MTATPTDGLCPDASLAFWGLEGPAARNWTRDALRLGYTLDGDALLVAFEDAEVLGWKHVEVEPGRAITADGDVLELGDPLSGEHTVRVVVYRDVNADGRYEPGVDEACDRDGEPVRAGPTTIDFDRFDG